jgi:hypothetical protein
MKTAFRPLIEKISAWLYLERDMFLRAFIDIRYISRFVLSSIASLLLPAYLVGLAVFLSSKELLVDRRYFRMVLVKWGKTS